MTPLPALAPLLVALVLKGPPDPVAAYDRACAEAKAGRAEAALVELSRSADAGFRFVSTLLRDEDLDAVRALPGYADVLARVRANNEAALVTFRERAARDARVVTILPGSLAPGERRPLLVALHPYGGTAAAFAEALRPVAARAGAVLVAPEALARVGDGFSWGVVEEGEHLVLAALANALATRPVDPSRVVLVGFSQGGDLAVNLLLKRPDLAAGAIGLSATHDRRVAPIPARAPDGAPRFAFLNGRLDGEADANRVAAKALERAGFRVLLRLYPNVGHELPPRRDREIGDALAFVLAR